MGTSRPGRRTKGEASCRTANSGEVSFRTADGRRTRGDTSSRMADGGYIFSPDGDQGGHLSRTTRRGARPARRTRVETLSLVPDGGGLVPDGGRRVRLVLDGGRGKWPRHGRQARGEASSRAAGEESDLVPDGGRGARPRLGERTMGEASSLRAEGGDASSRAADASCILEFLGTGNMRKGARSPHDQGAVSTERLWINARLFIGSWSSGDQQNYITSRYGFKSRVEKDL